MNDLEVRLDAIKKKPTPTSAYNPSGRAQVKGGANLFVTGDLLLWKAKENGIPLYIQNNGESLLNQAIAKVSSQMRLASAHARTFEWEWDWGFRLGAGYNASHDSWDIVLNWLHIHNHAQVHQKINPAKAALWPSQVYVQPLYDYNYSPCEEANAHWHLHLNQIDLELGREYFVSKWLRNNKFLEAPSKERSFEE